MLYTHMHSLVLGPCPFWFKMNMLEAHTLLNLLLLLTCTCSRHLVNFFQNGVEQCVLFVLMDDLYIWFVKILFILYYTYYIYLKNGIK